MMILRAPEPADIDALYEWENDPERLLQGRTGLPLSKQAITDYVLSYNEMALSTGQIRFMFDTEDSVPAGAIDLYDLYLSARRAFVSIYVSKNNRGKGLGSMAVKEICDFSRDQLGLFQLVAAVSDENQASLKLFEKSLFQRIAVLPNWVRRTDGNFTDAILFARIL